MNTLWIEQKCTSKTLPFYAAEIFVIVVFYIFLYLTTRCRADMGVSDSRPQTLRGHTGHRLGPGHSWLMQLGLSGKWLSKQGPEWLPLTGTSALSLLIHSKEPQSNTQRHTVTSNNTAWSEGTWNESSWPERGDRHQFAHQIWALSTGLDDDHRAPLLSHWDHVILPSSRMQGYYRASVFMVI